MSREFLLADFIVATFNVFFGDNSAGLVPYNQPIPQARTRTQTRTTAPVGSELIGPSPDSGQQLPKPTQRARAPGSSPGAPGSKQSADGKQRASAEFSPTQLAAEMGDVSVREDDAFREFDKVNVDGLFQVDDGVCPVEDQLPVQFGEINVGDQLPVDYTGRRSDVVTFPDNKLAKKMHKHGDDWGIPDHKHPNSAKLKQFKGTLIDGINNFEEIFGTFNGVPMIHYLDYSTGRNIMVYPENRTFKSAYILNEVQYYWVRKNGSLGNKHLSKRNKTETGPRVNKSNKNKTKNQIWKKRVSEPGKPS